MKPDILLNIYTIVLIIDQSLDFSEIGYVVIKSFLFSIIDCKMILFLTELLFIYLSNIFDKVYFPFTISLVR